MVQKQRSLGEAAGGSGASTSVSNKVRRGDIRHAVVVRTTKKYQRKDGVCVGFDDNACVLISKAGDPIGTRVNGMSSCLYVAYVTETATFAVKMKLGRR